MYEAVRHIADCLSEFRVRVAQGQTHHAGAEIVIDVTVHIM